METDQISSTLDDFHFTPVEGSRAGESELFLYEKSASEEWTFGFEAAGMRLPEGLVAADVLSGTWITQSDPEEVSVDDCITPAAQRLAESLGISESVRTTDELVRETLAGYLSTLRIDRKEDPEEPGYSTVCFTITLRSTVDEALTLGECLQRAFIERISADHRMFIVLTYNFES